MLNKEAKTKALREGLKKYLGNLSGKNVRVNKKARDNAKEKGLRFAKDFEERGYPRLGKAKREYTLELFNQHNEVIRPLARSRDKARAGTALAVGAVGGGALLAKKKLKGKEKTASVALISPVTLIAMREEFQEVYEKEAERVSVKVAKARLSEIIRERI